MRSPPTRFPLRAVLALALTGLPGFTGCLAATPVAGADTVLAVVDGKPITQGEVEQSATAHFDALERDYAQKRHAMLEQVLDGLVQQRLVAAEAARVGATEEELLATIAPTPVTDADVDFFFQQNEQRIRGTKEQMGAQIKEYLEQQNEQRAQQSFIAELRAKHPVDMRLEPLRVDVAATGPSRGGPVGAPVTIVEFADFQCPYCVRILPTIKQVLDTYGDKVRFVYRHYPLSIHSNAQGAAEASMCAQEQGKFWEMHDAMFADVGALGADGLKATAAGLGLDAAKFDSCLESKRYADEVAADFAAGTAAGVSGTPVLFVNGRFVNGAVPYEQLSEIVDDELRRRGVRTAQN